MTADVFIASAAHTLPLYTVAQLRALEADAARTLPPDTLMMRAGKRLPHSSVSAAQTARRTVPGLPPAPAIMAAMRSPPPLNTSARGFCRSLYARPRERQRRLSCAGHRPRGRRLHYGYITRSGCQKIPMGD